MFQRVFLFFICGYFLISCQFFQKKELSSDTLIDTIIDYNVIDVFPLFPKCDSIPSQAKQKICSQIKMSEHFYASLAASKIVTSKKVNDTILVSLIIDNSGIVSLSKIESSDFIQQQIPQLDSLIKLSVEEFPQLKPGIKRGIPVATAFSLPIVVKN